MTTIVEPVRPHTGPAALPSAVPAGTAGDSPLSVPGRGGLKVVGGGLLYTADQAAVMLSVKASWLVRKARSGAIPCHRIGKHLRFSAGDLEQILGASSRPAAGSEKTSST